MSPDRGVLATPTSGVQLNPRAKRCRRCDHVKPLTEFFRRSSSTDGRAYFCKTCVARTARDVRGRQRDLVRESAERRARELASSGRPIDYTAEHISVRVALLNLLDIPGRSPYETAERAGCSPTTVYRHRRVHNAAR